MLPQATTQAMQFQPAPVQYVIPPRVVYSPPAYQQICYPPCANNAQKEFFASLSTGVVRPPTAKQRGKCAGKGQNLKKFRQSTQRFKTSIMGF